MRLVRAIIGVVLIPVCFAVTQTVLCLMASLGAMPGTSRSLPVLAVGAGVLLWILLFYVLPKPVRTYVLAHELTHALWGSILGARVSGFRVSKAGGSVKVSDLHFLTVLAPYFFPLYTVGVILMYYLLALFMDLRPYEWIWFGLIGLTLGFHWTFTLATLFQPQSDVSHYGRLFSYTVIYLLNMLGIGVVLVMVSSLTMDFFVNRLILDIASTREWCGTVLWEGLRFIGQWIRRNSLGIW